MKFTRDAVRAMTQPPGQRCTIQLATLAPDERKELMAALEDRTLTLSAIRRALAARGVVIGESTLHNHRHHECRRCYGPSA